MKVQFEGFRGKSKGREENISTHYYTVMKVGKEENSKKLTIVEWVILSET